MNMMIEIPEELQTHVIARTPDWGLCKCNRFCIGSGNARSRSAVGSGKLVGMLQEGLDSEAEVMTPEYWKDLRSSIKTE